MKNFKKLSIVLLLSLSNIFCDEISLQDTFEKIDKDAEKKIAAIVNASGLHIIFESSIVAFSVYNEKMEAIINSGLTYEKKIEALNALKQVEVGEMPNFGAEINNDLKRLDYLLKTGIDAKKRAAREKIDQQQQQLNLQQAMEQVANPSTTATEETNTEEPATEKNPTEETPTEN